MQASTVLSGDVPVRLYQAESNGLFPVVLLLHAAGGNVSFWLNRIAPFVSRLGIAVYAVHDSDRTGTTRAATAEVLDGCHVPLWLDAVADTLLHVDARSVDSRRLAVLGHGGIAEAMRFRLT